MRANITSSLWIHTIVACIISIIFYSQQRRLAYAFLPPDAVSEHTMRLGGLLFLFVVIVNGAALIHTYTAPNVIERIRQTWIPKQSFVVGVALLCNAAILWHYALEALYYHSLNPIIFLLILLIAFLGLFDFIHISPASSLSLKQHEATMPQNKQTESPNINSVDKDTSHHESDTSTTTNPQDTILPRI